MSLYTPNDPSATDKKYIRGVNVGGWLVLERYITPYTFAVTDCHQRGDFCWYPGQIDAPDSVPGEETIPLCTHKQCQPVLSKNAFGKMDYPLDEWHLGAAFQHNASIGEEWLNSHLDNFLQKEDLIQAKKAGITHLRVPMPHWILGNKEPDEPWLVGDRWKYFLRLCEWVREIGGLELWPNIHTAPGSQNGFDNSGAQNSVKTCGGWNDNPHNIQRSLDVILEVTVALKHANVMDVVTGFGLLNEPFGDCNKFKYQQFLYNGMTIVRDVLGPDVSIYMSDLFQAPEFNDGRWGLDPQKFNNTFLDSHYYNIFSPAVRKMSPQKHMEIICEPEKGERVEDCCFEDPPANTQPSQGVQRIVAEWSSSYDAMPGEVLKLIMKSIWLNGEAVLMNRTLSQERMDFLTKFTQAQMVSYESAQTGVGHGWFFWTLKLEGGAYLEWDFLRGVKDGWFPKLAPPDTPSEDLYGTCEDIASRTTESNDIVHPYPWGDIEYWRGPLVNESDKIGNGNDQQDTTNPEHHTKLFPLHHWTDYGTQIVLVLLIVSGAIGWKKYSQRRKKHEYTEIQT